MQTATGSKEATAPAPSPSDKKRKMRTRPKLHSPYVIPEDSATSLPIDRKRDRSSHEGGGKP
eukprot:3603808-Rhodomonas_salina.1